MNLPTSTSAITNEPSITPSQASYTNELFSLPFMSQSNPPTSSSNNFQLVINNALDTYKKRTKKDLRSHPLATQLQSSKSPSEILDVLQEQVQGLNQSLRRDERWTRWLGPTVNVLYALSGTLGQGVSVVWLRTRHCLRSALSYLSGRYFHLQR